MSEAPDGLEPEALDAPVVEGAAADTTTTDNADVEAEALAMGWKPPGAFKGDDTKFVDAAEYVRRGKEIMPFLRKELTASNAKISKLEKTLERFGEYHTRTEQRAYERAKADLEAELHQAAIARDADAVKAITKDIVDLEREVSTRPEPKTETDEPPEFLAWKEENPWFGKDKAMTAATAAIGDEVADEGYSGKAMIKEVDRRIREAFPEKFAKPTNPNRTLPGAVEGGGLPARPGGKTFNDLPADAKKMCAEFERDIPGFKRETYVKEWFS